MSNLNQAWIGAVATLGVLGLTGGAVVYSGLADVSADTPHGPIVYRLLETARERAIARRSTDITPPMDLDAAERQRQGAGNYAAMCADCHLVPGEENSEIRRGLYPIPPDLTRANATEGSQGAARQFWIIKHGIKASGMPAWSKGGMEDAAIWDLVAFLKKLPGLSPEQYQSLVEASDGHSHAGAPHAEPEPADKGHDHDHGDHVH
ncbi:MAG: cytochrome c [Thiobacillus sp.]|nr:cytochrome c [Thiobacillus sp.]